MDADRSVVERDTSSSTDANHSEQRSRYPWGSASSSCPLGRTSYTPSYMSIPRKPPLGQEQQNGYHSVSHSRHPSTAAESSAELLPSHGPPGVLFVIFARSLYTAVLQHVETVLQRQSFEKIVFVAVQEQESTLKQLKVDTYALLGKLRREMGVETVLGNSWRQAEVGSLLEHASTGAGLQGVICCPHTTDAPSDLDILNIEEDVLANAWKQNTAFLHAMSRAAMPHLIARARHINGTSTKPATKEPHGPFFIVATWCTQNNPAVEIVKAASDALMHQLQVAAKGVTVGYADTLLIPDPEPKVEKPRLDSIITSPGQICDAEGTAFDAGESPTKLWNIWALQDQIDQLK